MEPKTSSDSARSLHVIRDEASGFGAHVRRITYRSDVNGITDWALLERPADSATTRWIVNLHGHGATGDQLYTRPDIRDDWLPMFRELGVGILALNLRGNAWMGPAAAADLRAMLRWLREQHHAHQLIFVGGSMGGTSCLAYAGLEPTCVAGMVAMCPATDVADYHGWCTRHTDYHPVIVEIRDAIELAYGGTPESSPATYAGHRAILQADQFQMPLAIIHGDDDGTIPVGQSRALVHAMGDAPNLHYKELPGGDHNAPLSYCREGLTWVLDRLEKSE